MRYGTEEILYIEDRFSIEIQGLLYGVKGVIYTKVLKEIKMFVIGSFLRMPKEGSLAGCQIWDPGEDARYGSLKGC